MAPASAVVQSGTAAGSPPAPFDKTCVRALPARSSTADRCPALRPRQVRHPASAARRRTHQSVRRSSDQAMAARSCRNPRTRSRRMRPPTHHAGHVDPAHCRAEVAVRANHRLNNCAECCRTTATNDERRRDRPLWVHRHPGEDHDVADHTKDHHADEGNDDIACARPSRPPPTHHCGDHVSSRARPTCGRPTRERAVTNKPPPPPASTPRSRRPRPRTTWHRRCPRAAATPPRGADA